MSRPGIGNPGNRGGRPYSAENRSKAAVFKTLVLDESIRTMRDGSPAQKRELMLRSISSCLPKDTEIFLDRENDNSVIDIEKKSELLTLKDQFEKELKTLLLQ